MKKLLITLFLFMAIVAIHATNTISLTSAEGRYNDEVQIDVSLENSDAITAVEITIPLDKNLTYVNASASMNSARSNGHLISAAEVDNELRIYIYSLSLGTLKGNEGVLCSFKLKLKREPAVYAITPSVVLGDVAGNSLAVEVESAIVTILAPKLEIQTKDIDFGHIPIRSTYTRSVALKNVGTTALSVSSITIDDENFEFSETAFTIAAGETKSVSLQYAPLNWGTISRTISVVSDAMNGKQTATVVADPFSVNELYVGQVSGIADSIEAVPITMNNMEPIVGAQFSFKLPEALVYDGVELSGRATDHVALGTMNGDELTIVIYSPTNSALKDTDGKMCDVKFRLNGTSGWYYLSPENVVLSNVGSVNMTSAVYGEYVVIQSPEMYGEEYLNFGSSPVTEKATTTYSIYNGGQAPLTIERVTFLAEGYNVSTKLPLIIEPYQTDEISVEYTPTVEGKFSTTMNVYTNDPNNRMKNVAVSGEIYEPNSLSLSGSMLADGYSIDVVMDNYSDIVAMQFDVHWLAGMTTDASLMKTTSRLNSHTASITKIGEADYRVVVFSMTNAAIAGHNGDVISLVFKGLSPAEYNNSSIVVDNILLSNSKSVNKVSTLMTQWNVNLYSLILGVNDDNMGSVVGDAGFYESGTEVTISAVAKPNYHFVRWSDGSTEVMRTISVTSNISLIAEFAINTYTVDATTVNGTVSGLGTYNYGTEVTLTVTPNEGYHFVKWSDGDTNATRTIIVTDNVTLTAEFAINVYTVTLSAENGTVTGADEYEHGTEVSLTATPNEGYHFVKWSDGEPNPTRTIIVTDNVTLTAEFAINVYTVTLTAENGTVTGAGQYEHGKEVAISATPNEGYHFVKWSDGATEATRTITVTNNVTLTAEFAINVYTVTLTAENGIVTGAGEYEHGTEVTLTASPNEGYHFVKWSDGDTNATRSIIVTSNVTLTAEFAINVYTVTLTAENGTVTGSGEYEHGTEVTLTTTPNEGYHFVKWSDGATEATRTITVTDNVTLTAEFAINVYTVTLTAENGTVIGSGQYEHGKEVAISATPNEGYHFVKWSDGVTDVTRTIMVIADVTLTAEFAINVYTVTLTAENGTVTSSGEYEHGKEVAISATPNEGYHFVKWSDGETNPTRTIKVTSDLTLTAEFAINVYTVTLSTENGTVTGSGEYEHGTEVTLTATPNEGYHFVKWSDGETNPTRAIKVTSDLTLTAEFIINVYIVTLTAENGTVTGSGEYEHGKEVAISATANEGYHFVKWSDGDTNATRSIIVISNVTLTAEFAINVYTVTLTAENGTVIGAGEYENGTEVTLTATPNEGYHFVKWSDGDTNATRSIIVISNVTLTAEFAINVYTVTLSAENGTVTGSGEYEHGTEVTLTATPNEGYHFVKWSDGETNPTRTITVTSNLTLSAEFAINVYTVTLTAENGIVTGAGEYEHGTEVTLAATPNEGYHFVKWSDGETNPTRTIIVTDNVTLTAEFAINVYTVTLSAENGTVTGSGEYEHGKEVIISATPNEGYHFVKWSDGETNPIRTIIVTDNVTLTAEFAINVYAVTLTAENGIVTGSGEYEHGTEVTLTATPNEGYHFVKWSDGETNPTRTIIVTDNVTLTAEFAINVYTVTLTAENGTVTGAGEYEHGKEVAISATANEGYHFVKWSDGATEATRTITVTDNVTLTAEFAINVYTVTLTAENGIVTGAGEYEHGTEVTLTATPNEGYHFVKWSDGETNPTRTIIVTDNVTLTAEFAINVYTVTLTAENGTVTGSGEYNHGTEVTLTATPNEGYHFVKWSDGETNPTRTIIVTDNVTLTAEFAINVYTVTLTAENGTVTGSGEYNHGTEVTLTATPNEGYHFVKWSDGETNPTRTIIITDNVTLTAEFAINVYIVTLTAENGTVTGSGEYEHGTEVTLTATPNEGYHFVKWSDGETNPIRTIIVTDNVTLTAEFELDALVEVDDVVESHIIAYSHNQTLYVEGIKGDYYVLDMTGNVVYYGQSSVVSLPCGVYMIVADGERHKVMIR